MIASIIGAAASLAGSVYGGIQAKKQADKAEQEQRARERKNDDWYNRRYNEDYLQTAEAQNAIRQAKEFAQKQIQAARGAQAVGGGTEEMVASAQQSANDMIGNTMANIAAQGTARKDNIDAQYRGLADQLAQQRIATYNQRAANSTAAASGAMQAGMGLVNLDMQSGAQTGKGLFESWMKQKKAIQN